MDTESSELTIESLIAEAEEANEDVIDYARKRINPALAAKEKIQKKERENKKRLKKRKKLEAKKNKKNTKKSNNLVYF